MAELCRLLPINACDFVMVDGCNACISGTRANSINAHDETMAAKTVHVYRSDGAWQVKKEGKSAKIFSTQRKAVEAAKKSVKKERAGQFVVHGRNGQIREYGTYRMTRIQDPPKKSRLAARIARAVGKVALERVQSDPSPPSDHSA